MLYATLHAVATPPWGGLTPALAPSTYKDSIVRITNLTFLAFYLNSAIDTGNYVDVTYQEVADKINDGSIFSYLRTRLGNDIDLSIFPPEKQRELVDEWQNILNAVSARRKFGIENNGLCLLVAYLLEGIQRRQDKNPSE